MTTTGNASATSWTPFEAHASMSEADAIVEAEACLQCGGPQMTAPCVAACPAGIDVPGFINAIAQGSPADAADIIFRENILGGSCARVCPVEVLCEGSCVLKKEGRHPIQIARLQRFATDRAFETGAVVVQQPPATARHREESVCVVGAGPAGLACAAELAQLGYSVTVYEQRQVPGGLITHGIAPYKQQIDPMQKEVAILERMGVVFRFGVAVGREISVELLRKWHKALFIGVGMGEDTPAGIPGEDLPGVWESLRFIEAIKLDGGQSLEIGPRVAVVGGGNTAIDVGREAVMLGATDVMLLYRRTEAQMPAYAHEVAAARKEGVKIMPLVAPVAFLGTDRVRAVRCIRMQLGAPDSSGRPRPEPIPGSEFEIEVDSAITAIGQKPRADFFRTLGIELSRGIVKVNEDFQTTVPSFFAGGDCLNGGATVVEAVRDGKVAAHGIHRFLRSCPRPQAHLDQPAQIVHSNGVVRNFQLDAALHTAPLLCKGCGVCVESCPAQMLRLDGSNRITVVDVNQCVFCGLCEARCPDFAIWIVRGRATRARSTFAVSELRR